MAHSHSHPHPSSTERHSPARDSLLCASAGQRLALAAGAGTGLWLVVWWALSAA